MITKKQMLIAIILLTAVLSVTSLEARELASAKIEVRATIPPMQRLTVFGTGGRELYISVARL